MTHEALARSASARRLVDPPAPQHGVDEPHQLSGRKHERPAMLVARRLAELLLVVGTELLRREPHRVCRLDHVVAQIDVAGLGERAILPLELPGLVAPPGEAAKLSQRLLALEAPYVADLGDDAGAKDRAEAGDGRERLGRSRLKLGGYSLLDGLDLRLKRPHGGERGAQEEVHGFDHGLRKRVGAPGGLLDDLRNLLGIGDPAPGMLLDEGGQVLDGSGHDLVGGKVALQNLLGSRPEGVRERPFQRVGRELEVDVGKSHLLLAHQLGYEMPSVAGEPLKRLVTLVEIALRRKPSEAQAVGDDHGVCPVVLADVGVALLELLHLAGVEGVAPQAAGQKSGVGGEEGRQVPPEEVGGLKAPQDLPRSAERGPGDGFPGEFRRAGKVVLGLHPRSELLAAPVVEAAAVHPLGDVGSHVQPRRVSSQKHHSSHWGGGKDVAEDGPKKSRLCRCLVISTPEGEGAKAKVPASARCFAEGSSPTSSGRRLRVGGHATEHRGATLFERSLSKKSRKEVEAFPIRPPMVRPAIGHGGVHHRAGLPPSPVKRTWRRVGPDGQMPWRQFHGLNIRGGEPKKLLSPSRRRAAVEHVRRRLGVSERRACRVIAQPRSSQRYEGRKANRDRDLLQRMVELSRENPRYGYRRVWALLRREGWPVNKKRVHRLWRQEGLKVPDRQRKRRRLGDGENSCTRKRAEHLNHVWSYDFVMDETEDGRRLKMMPVVDEYTRECLSIDVERSITAEDVVSTLASLFRSRGEPAFIRSDNGPEFIARAIKEWLEVSGVRTLYIEPGSPWENAYSETFISRFGDELLKREVFADLLEAKVLVEDYRGHYNHHRP